MEPIIMKCSSGRGVPATHLDFQELEKLVNQQPTPDRAAAKLAKLLKVQRTEVALLRVQDGMLKFIYPAELRTAGAIPVSSNAVAARTVTTCTSLMSNSFARINHVRHFESIRLEDGSQSEAAAPAPIQKLISVPVQRAKDEPVLGVIQISRKGLDVRLAGPDFTNDELQLAERAATIIAQMEFMLGGTTAQAAAAK
jgi:GAF domain-containing protein